MTPDQVLQAEAGARRVEKPEKYKDLTNVVAVDGIHIGKDDFRAEKRFIGKYGPPTNKFQGGPGGNSPRVFWELPNTTIRLVHLNVFGISRVNFSYIPSKAREPKSS